MVTASAQGKSRPDKVPKLSFTIKRGTVPNDVRVDMSLVGMCTNKKRKVPLRKTHGKLIPNAICFLRRYFAGLETLSDVVGDDIPLALIPSSEGSVSLFGQQELGICCSGIAFV
jgi:hypothetical protein